MNLKLFWHRLIHWEFWPFQLIYYPLFPLWLYYSIKARSFFFFNAANPCMTNGGMTMESKMEIYKKIPKQFIPKTVLIPANLPAERIAEMVRANGISFPCIAKPDIGMKSLGVEKITSTTGLLRYQQRHAKDFLVQELIPYPKEVGIFYVRQPGQNTGKITGIVSKEFLSVTGDGYSTILELIKGQPRSHFQLKTLQKKLGDSINEVLPDGESYVLVPFGSHTRGAKFTDISEKINPELTALINGISTKIDDFYYGRLDILYTSFEALCQGKDFSVIEINGAGSEATHIYDPKHSIFYAWREINRHWHHLYTISVCNHRKGYPYLSYKDGRAMLKASNEMEAQLRLM